MIKGSSRIFAQLGNTRCIFWDGQSRFFNVLTKDFLSKKPNVRLKNFVGRSSGVSLVSVVPKAEKRLRMLKWSSVKSLKLKDIPIRPAYTKGIGLDRVLKLYRARNMTSYSRVVIDFGTAITVDFLSAQGAHLGGWILPGLCLISETLHEKTAALPYIAPHSRMASRQSLGGKSTRESLIQGQRHYVEAILERAMAQARRRFGEDCKCIITGGDAILLKKRKYCIHEPLLLLKGLRDLEYRKTKL